MPYTDKYQDKNDEHEVTVFDREKQGKSMVLYFWDAEGYPESMVADKFHAQYKKTKQTDGE